MHRLTVGYGSEGTGAPLVAGDDAAPREQAGGRHAAADDLVAAGWERLVKCECAVCPREGDERGGGGDAYCADVAGYGVEFDRVLSHVPNDGNGGYSCADVERGDLEV